MEFNTMADVEAHYRRQGELMHLRVQARDLCNVLCGKLDWTHTPERTAKITRALMRARARLARREERDDDN